MFNNSPPPNENPAVYAIIWKKKYVTARQATDDNIIRRMRVVYWLDKTTQTALIRSSTTHVLHIVC